jgi:predicted nucleic acid-binding protein
MFVLADSGILIRLYETSDPLHAVVRLAVDTLEARGDELVAAHQNFAEFWNVCTRPTTARGGLGLSLPATEGRLARAEGRFGRLAELRNVYANWRQLLVTHGVRGKQVHDARLVAIMQAHGIAHILTLNVADFTRYPGITVLDPAQIVPPTP